MADDTGEDGWKDRLDDWVVFQQNSRNLKPCDATVDLLTREFMANPGSYGVTRDQVWNEVRAAFDYGHAPVPVTVTLSTDWTSKDRMNQFGHVEIRTATGLVEATWECRGGKGKGADVVSNSTKEFEDDDLDDILSLNELWQGSGTYKADIVCDDDGFNIINLEWDPKGE